MPGAGGVIDSFWIALGIKPDLSGVKDIKKGAEEAKQSLIGIGTAVKAFLGGVAIKAVADLGNSFEQNTIAISGFLEALNFSKAGEGMADAEKTLKSINTAAAKLPGEAEEYIEVFRAGIPVLKGAMPGGSIQAMTDFTNRFTAIGKTLQVDAGQIGRDLSLLLGPKGRAGGNVLTFQRMLPFIRQLKGHAEETAESFNLLTQPKRLALLQEALANPALSSMLDRSANSFDAMMGAAKSMVKTVLRLSTAGVFKGMKQGLDELRALFVDDKGEVTALGKSFVEAGKEVSRVVVQLVSMLGGMVKWILKSETAMKLLKGALVVVGVALGALALQQTVGWLGKMFTAVFNLKKLLLGGLLVALVLIAEDIYTFLVGGESVIGMLLNKFPIATKVAIAAIAGIGAAFVAFRIGAVLQMGLVAAGATTAGAAVGRGFSAALGPIGALFAVLTLTWELLDEADKKFDWVNKVSNMISSITGIKRTAEPDSLQNFKSQPGFKKFDPNGPPAFLATPLPVAKTMPAYSPSQNFTSAGGGDGVTSSGSGPTVNIGDVTIKSDNPRDAGRVFMNTVRDAQSKVSH